MHLPTKETFNVSPRFVLKDFINIKLVKEGVNGRVYFAIIRETKKAVALKG